MTFEYRSPSPLLFYEMLRTHLTSENLLDISKRLSKDQWAFVVNLITYAKTMHDFAQTMAATCRAAQAPGVEEADLRNGFLVLLDSIENGNVLPVNDLTRQ